MAEQMKPSGIDWIGDIPVSWSISRLKFMLANEEDSLKVGPFGSSLSGTDYIPDGKWVFNQRVVLDNNFIDNDTCISDEKFQEMKSFSVYPEDILITTRGTIGKVAIVPQNAPQGILHPCIIKFRLNKKLLLPELLKLLFNETSYAQEQFAFMNNSTTIDVIYSYSLKDIILPLIPINEQKAIYAFLHKECDQIDSIAADLEKQIELLQQYKKSLITETVTKGLDKSVPMKDIGNPIIGYINYWYATKKLKYIVATPITDGPHETPVLVDDGIPFLSAESVKNGILDFEYKRGYISESDHKFFCKKIKPQKNDVFIVKSGATTGNVGIVTVDQEFSIWSPLALIRCDDKTVLQKFIYYCVSSNYFKQEIEQAWSYGTQQNIGMGVIENLTVVIPPIDEQKKIVRYLDDALASMDEIIIDKTKQLEIIQQHKKSLIYEYVTGKKRVKEAQ